MVRDAEEERRLVDQLRVYQLQKLDEHRWKGHWEGDDLELLMILLRSEVRELEYELFEGGSAGVSTRKVLLECADVANFAAMIADVVKARCTPPAATEPGEVKA